MDDDDNRLHFLTTGFAMTLPLDLTPSLLPGMSGAVRLTEWGVIRARGADAATFLQGQLTQDVISLPLFQARLAGYCSAKGRLLATFLVWKTGPEEFLLACSADLLATTLKRLSMYVMRAQCKLSDASLEWPVWGLLGPAALAWLGADGALGSVTSHLGGQALRLPDVHRHPRWLWLAPASVDGEAASGPAGLPALALADWQALEVASGVMRVVAATVEAFVPQMVNLELVGGVNFKKGCYPGQEVVARSQYRGTLKRRGVLLGADVPMQAGLPVFHSADPGQPAGTVAMAAGPLAFVELKRAALTEGTLHLENATGPHLTLLPLPYPLPNDEA